MEDMKLEFPSLPQCKEDAEVSLSCDCHAQASFRGSAGKRPQAPNSGSPRLCRSPVEFGRLAGTLGGAPARGRGALTVSQ